MHGFAATLTLASLAISAAGCAAQRHAADAGVADAGATDTGAPTTHHGEPDAGPSAIANGCPPGWTEEPDACVRWTLAAPYPEACWPETPEAGRGFYGHPLVRCGERGYRYVEHDDRWEAEVPRADPEDWSDRGGLATRSETCLATPLWVDNRLLSLCATWYSGTWRADRVSLGDEDVLATPPPPSAVWPDVLLPIAADRALAAGATQSAIYERVPKGVARD